MSLEQPQPQYRQLAERLRDSIERGEPGFEPGAMLEPEPVLASRYGVSKSTVNNAVAILRTWGLVKVKRGRGTMIRELPVIHRNATARYSRESRERAGAHGAFDSEIRGLGLEPRTETTVDTIDAPADVAADLGMEPGARVIRRMRYMYANDIPVQIAPSYIPAEIGAGTAIEQVDSGPGGIISRFRDLGYEQVRITESVRARPATSEERSFLGLQEDQQVLEIRHRGWTAEGRVVELAVHAVPAGQWALEYDFPAS